MTSLLDMTRAMDDLHRDIEAAHGEISPELALRLDELGTALAKKVDNMAEYIAAIEGRAQAMRDFAKKVEQKAKVNENFAKRLLDYCDMALGDSDTLEGRLFTMKRVKNPPSVEVLDESVLRGELPDAFKEHVSVTLSKAYVKAMLESGKDIKGAKLVQGTRIAFK